ncbi:MAG: hypothetical protein JNN20_10590 [Betaproteobacteria bacterium]|nr:hypothetical protein [Betaproteobacteria bacterium]
MRCFAPSFITILLALAFAAPAAAQPATVKIGKETKNAIGTILDLQDGDIACSMVMKDDNGAEFFESGDFDLCMRKKALIGKRVALTYKMAKVMAESCQGDINCKKSDLIPLVVAVKVLEAAKVPVAPAKKPAVAGQTSFCTPLETVVYSCRAGAKMVSVCASKDASPTRGYVQYRFGKPDSREPLELMLPEGQPVPPQSATGENVPFTGGGGAWMRFRKGPFGYVIYTGIGKWGPKGETREKDGIVVERDGKRIAHLKCTDTSPGGELGPDWLGKVGIKTNGEEFLFPD